MTLTDLETREEVLGWTLSVPGGRRLPLSPRERQIIDLVVGGSSHKEAAFQLGISDVTVRVLYARAMKKMGRSKLPRSKSSTRR